MISYENIQFYVSTKAQDGYKEEILLMTRVNMWRNILCNLNMHMFNSVIDAFKKAVA